jgi:hypothetical protein
MSRRPDAFHIRTLLSQPGLALRDIGNRRLGMTHPMPPWTLGFAHATMIQIKELLPQCA